ncbi:hypothetical protein BHE90_014397 [Fusarium euwallaceae]|uniref:Uncharacterized protein n=2 Tax=Fusarium solani species complex TaxID=232080 RepID=A0A3M2RY07_9HYPO|nr:hypothetical protein CDV36_010184 [Fusarium kuroshium]RTE71210.1 hypothetical protein BHE90_014397 [Fusarium euwallaceae]
MTEVGETDNGGSASSSTDNAGANSSTGFTVKWATELLVKGPLAQFKKDTARGPKNLIASWDSLATDNVFLHEGEAPWFALLLARNGAIQSSHFAGQAEYRRLIPLLEAQPASTQRAVAREVASAMSKETRDKIETLFKARIHHRQDNDSQERPNKRRRTIDHDSIPTPAPSTSQSDRASGHQPPRQLSDSEPSWVPPINSAVPLAPEMAFNADLGMASGLLPRRLFNAVARNPDPTKANSFSAAIWMSFRVTPFSEDYACQMAIEIEQSEISYYAREWFGVQLHTKSGLRYISAAEGGAMILPQPKLILQGCRIDAIASGFGPEVSQAIMASPGYAVELGKHRDTTNTISMEISHRAEDRAIIYASLGLWEGTTIEASLFQWATRQ